MKASIAFAVVVGLLAASCFIYSKQSKQLKGYGFPCIKLYSCVRPSYGFPPYNYGWDVDGTLMLDCGWFCYIFKNNDKKLRKWETVFRGWWSLLCRIRCRIVVRRSNSLRILLGLDWDGHKGCAGTVLIGIVLTRKNVMSCATTATVFTSRKTCLRAVLGPVPWYVRWWSMWPRNSNNSERSNVMVVVALVDSTR